jgi:hypothetical protein
MTLSLRDLDIESFSGVQRNTDKLIPTPKHTKYNSPYNTRQSYRSDCLCSTTFNTVHDRHASQAA